MQLPDKLKQAIDNNAFCALSTKINDKEMQNHLMWVDYKDNQILINTEQGRKKTENIRKEPNISLVIFHPSDMYTCCLLYTSPSPRDKTVSRMPSSA